MTKAGARVSMIADTDLVLLEYKGQKYTMYEEPGDLPPNFTSIMVNTAVEALDGTTSMYEPCSDVKIKLKSMKPMTRSGKRQAVVMHVKWTADGVHHANDFESVFVRFDKAYCGPPKNS
jgi:hypothetical protein